ncbi:MAG: hypothetical protein JXD19_02550 [Deltaproteobacteria bacterium]|nr:hypothetical protein [Deltaproteobacteria bacterium]
MGLFGETFGTPTFILEICKNRITAITTHRGAPCGATWRAARRIRGMSVEDALTRVGLEIQLACSADPAAWDPLVGTSPLHHAAAIHVKALTEAAHLFLHSGTCGDKT